MALNPNPKPPNGYDLSRDEAAPYCGSKPATFADYARRGEGPPYIVVGGRAWYRKADLDRWLESRVRRPVSLKGQAA